MSTSEKLRSMATVYLTCGDKMLLLWRQGASVAANLWIGSAGGHFEPEDMGDARACVLREMREELGLAAPQIENLALRYVVLRRVENEIRQNYYFFAELPDGMKRELTSTEGTLRWVEMTELSQYEMPITARGALEHWLATGQYTDTVYSGVTEQKQVFFAEIIG